MTGKSDYLQEIIRAHLDMKVTKAVVVSSDDGTGKLRFSCHYISTVAIIPLTV